MNKKNKISSLTARDTIAPNGKNPIAPESTTNIKIKIDKKENNLIINNKTYLIIFQQKYIISKKKKLQNIHYLYNLKK